MSNEADAAFLARRRDECIAKAQEATDPSIAKLHRDFADRYDRAIKALQEPVLRQAS